MTDLSSIPGLGKSSQELLDAAGFDDLESLAGASAEELTRELARANDVLKIAKRPPARANVEKWIRAAREALGEPESVEETPAEPVNHERNPEVAAMLAGAPFAIPLPARHLVEKRLAVSEIPPAVLLNEYVGDLDVRVTDRAASGRRQSSPAVGYVQLGEATPQRLEIDTARMKSTDEFLAASTPRRPAPAPAEKRDDRVTLLRAPREETNRGKDPNSRRYIRGVLHTHPHSLSFGAVITLLLMVVLPVAIASGVLLLLSDLMPETFDWVPKWLLAFPIALPILGIAYLIWGVSGRCRICGQRLFVPRACRKNVKAHHVPGLGYILPVSVHMLLFRWFRCTFCGTPVRLKK